MDSHPLQLLERPAAHLLGWPAVAAAPAAAGTAVGQHLHDLDQSCLQHLLVPKLRHVLVGVHLHPCESWTPLQAGWHSACCVKQGSTTSINMTCPCPGVCLAMIVLFMARGHKTSLPGRTCCHHSNCSAHSDPYSCGKAAVTQPCCKTTRKGAFVSCIPVKGTVPAVLSWRRSAIDASLYPACRFRLYRAHACCFSGSATRLTCEALCATNNEVETKASDVDSLCRCARLPYQHAHRMCVYINL